MSFETWLAIIGIVVGVLGLFVAYIFYRKTIRTKVLALAYTDPIPLVMTLGDRVSKVTGDRYAGEWPREQFRKCGMNYVPSPKPKSDLYRDLLPLLNSRRVDLLDNKPLIAQLTGLERRTARSDKALDSNSSFDPRAVAARDAARAKSAVA